LSHYCPTAAGMLGRGDKVSIEERPRGFPADGEYVGLDAHEGLPPRLRPDMLMDWESWWQWERLSVRALAEARDLRAGMDRLHNAVEHTRSWRHSEGTLASRVEEAFRLGPSTRAAASEPRKRLQEVRSSMPDDVRPDAPGPDGEPTSIAVRRDFLIAHAFANWSAHLGQGLRTWLRSIEAADALIESGLCVGAADLWLRHLSDPWALADVWAQAEKD